MEGDTREKWLVIIMMGTRQGRKPEKPKQRPLVGEFLSQTAVGSLDGLTTPFPYWASHSFGLYCYPECGAQDLLSGPLVAVGVARVSGRFLPCCFQIERRGIYPSFVFWVKIKVGVSLGCRLVLR